MPVAHVLEHLDRDHPVESARGREVVDVGGDDLEVAQPAAFARGLDPLALAVRVRDAGDRRARVLLGQPQRQRPQPHPRSRIRMPSATARARRSARASPPRPRPGSATPRPQAARVLAPRPQDQPEELGRQLVVLLVGLLGHLGHRPRGHPLDEGAQPSCWAATPPADSRRSRSQAPNREPARSSASGSRPRCRAASSSS